MIRITLPNSLSLSEAMEFSCIAANIERADHYIFDFGPVRNVEPFGMLIISSEIQRIVSKHEDTTFSCENYSRMSYAGHMGFFKAFGLDHGKSPGEAKGSSRYVPLKIFNCQRLISTAQEQGKYVGDVIESECENIASILLCGNDHTDVHETLSYSLREIMRNVVEHSEADQFGVCAQFWPSKNLVEFAIIDRGVGLKTTLTHNPHLNVTDDKSAINYSLMPAVSGKAFKGARQKVKGPWANSGFGLYMTSRLCRNGGNFFIASGDTGMLLTSKGGKRYFPCGFSGTAVRMVIDTSLIGSLSESLGLYRKEGFEIQKTYAEIVNIDPSSASLMLSKDFDLSVWQTLSQKLKG